LSFSILYMIDNIIIWTNMEIVCYIMNTNNWFKMPYRCEYYTICF
jgi:hypothetical protein